MECALRIHVIDKSTTLFLETMKNVSSFISL